MQIDTQLAACVACPPVNKGMPDSPTAREYFSVCKNTMNLPGLEGWQHIRQGGKYVEVKQHIRKSLSGDKVKKSVLDRSSMLFNPQSFSSCSS